MESPVRYPAPPYLKLEHYERRKQAATLDNVGLAITLIPGCNGIGAVVKNFTDAILIHDVCVKKVEEQWVCLEGLQKDFSKKNRLYRNLDGAWNTMNSNQADFDEYLLLKPRMVNMEERIKRITDAKAKIKAETDFKRFLELEPINSRLAEAQHALVVAQEERDAARVVLLENERILTRLREQERDAARKITDDHIVADEKGVMIAQIFPNIISNYVLHSVNDVPCEEMPFDKVNILIKKQKPPHFAVFRRYDFRFDPFRQQWFTLQELREMGVCIDDPMISRSEFVQLAARGDFEGVKAVLLRGEDPDACDYTGVSAMLAAAANRQSDVIELLFRAGAMVDSRDKNLMTPLLAATMKGYLDVVRVLIEKGADRKATDKNLRNVLYFALTSQNVNMVKYFLNAQNCNEVESLWGFTPMHTVANLGNLELIKLVLSYGGSIYRKCYKGRTAEEVAQEAGHGECVAFLADERWGAAGQLAFKAPELGIQVWLGDYSALDPRWSTDVGITEVVCLPTIQQRPSNMSWLKDDEQCKHLTVLVDAEDDDNSTTSWDALSEKLPQIIRHLIELFKKGGAEILICDPSGKSTSAAVLAVVLLLHFQLRVTEKLADFAVARPRIQISNSMRRGLELMQRSMDERKLKRLDAKVRNAKILSCTF